MKRISLRDKLSNDAENKPESQEPRTQLDKNWEGMNHNKVKPNKGIKHLKVKEAPKNETNIE